MNRNNIVACHRSHLLQQTRVTYRTSSMGNFCNEGVLTHLCPFNNSTTCSWVSSRNKSNGDQWWFPEMTLLDGVSQFEPLNDNDCKGNSWFHQIYFCLISGRKRKWFDLAEAREQLSLHKPVQVQYLELLTVGQDVTWPTREQT